MLDSILLGLVIGIVLLIPIIFIQNAFEFGKIRCLVTFQE